MTKPVIALAGASGDLGGRITRALVARGAHVRALARPDAPEKERADLRAMGAEPSDADPTDATSIATACIGATCVISALSGVRKVMVDRQSVLLDGAVRAGVPRFIPSDFAADFTRTRPGHNRNFDLRREFMGVVDRTPIRATSILNGAFMDMLGTEMPIIRPEIRRVLYWRDASQPLDFTTKDDTAAFTAAAALDDDAPRILHIAGDVVSARDIARIMSEVTGTPYHPLWAGSLPMLGAAIAVTKLLAPGGDAAFPPWQGMQYMRDQFSGRAKLQQLDNGRYEGLIWTRVADLLRRRQRDGLDQTQ